MVEPAAATPIGIAVMGGVIHATTYGTKAYIDGESVQLGKMALTVVLGGVIGLLFALSGYTPTAVEWPILLAAYTGFIAELEAALKLLARGYVNESEERFRQAADEATSATGHLAYENRDRVIGGVLARSPRTAAALPNDVDESDLADPEETPGPASVAGEAVADPYPGSIPSQLAQQAADRDPEPEPEPEPTKSDHPGFEPKDGGSSENGDRLHQLYEWLNGNPDWADTGRAGGSSSIDSDQQDREQTVITDGP